jgi:hypothetical protein
MKAWILETEYNEYDQNGAVATGRAIQTHPVAALCPCGRVDGMAMRPRRHRRAQDGGISRRRGSVGAVNYFFAAHLFALAFVRASRIVAAATKTRSTT